jgi:hypothetical protein
MTVVDMLAIEDIDGTGAEEELKEELPTGPEALGMGVSETVDAALRGELSPDYVAKYYENKKLKPKHMKMLRMAVAGYSNNEIAAKMDYTPARVSIILNHQDSLAIMARMVGAASDRLGIQERLQALAPEMVEHIVGVTRTTHDNKLRSRNAFDLLKIAGYSGVTKVEDVTPRAAMNPAIMEKFTKVLEESNALMSSAYDPARRSLSRAAQTMIEGEAVEVASSGSVSDDAARSSEGSPLPVCAVPPGNELQQPSPSL